MTLYENLWLVSFAFWGLFLIASWFTHEDKYMVMMWVALVCMWIFVALGAMNR